MFYLLFFLRIRRPPISNRTDTLFPYTTLFRSEPDRQREPLAAPVVDALGNRHGVPGRDPCRLCRAAFRLAAGDPGVDQDHAGAGDAVQRRSDEHTSELQSLMRTSYAVICWKKKKITN